MNSLIQFFISKSRATIAILLLLVISGISAYKSIPRESTPDVKIPIIYVSLRHEGISPEDAERMLVRPVEDEVNTIEGIKEIRSVASTGYASVTMEFNAGFNSDKALDEIREAVDKVKTKLPEETEEPRVHEINLSEFPVLNVILLSDIPERSLINIAKKLKDKIELIPSVLEVDIAGEREDMVEVVIEPHILESYGISSELINVIRNNNLLVSAGILDTGSSGANGSRFGIKVPGVIETFEDIINFPIKSDEYNALRFKDLAEIRQSYKDATSFASVNQSKAVVLEISKRTGENIIQTVSAVKQVLQENEGLFQGQIQLLYAQDESGNILNMLSDLQNNLFLAFLLVLVVVMAFIGIRSSMMVAFSIPVSFLIGILLINHLGLTLNIVVLFSLIMSVGMLVDSAIIVVEYASRLMSQGKTKVQAYAESAKRMSLPIIASTATTLVVFAPLLFWPGIMGQFMKYLPLTLICVLIASVFTALIFMPSVGSLFGASKTSKEKQSNLKDKYIKYLKTFLNNPFKFLSGFTALIFIIVALFVVTAKGVEFFPSIEPDNAKLQVRARGNLSVYEKADIMKEVEEISMQYQNEVRVVYTRAGEFSGGGNDLPEDVIGLITLEFQDWQKRRKANEILEDMQTKLDKISGVKIEAAKEKKGPASDKAIIIEVAGNDRAEILQASKLITQKLEDEEEIINVESDIPVPSIEWVINIKRDIASQFGVSIAEIGNFIRLITNGLKVTTYRPETSDDEVDVVIRFPSYARDITQLDNLNIVSGDNLIPASNFIEREAKPTTGIIKRVDGKRAYTVKADVKRGTLPNNKIKELTNWLSEQYDAKVFSPNIQVRFKGDDESKKETQKFLSSAFGTALLLMFIILLIQFNNIFQAVLIMSAIFLSTIGVLFGLMITGQPFGIVMCGVGVISLAGVVVNNNIILIDTYNEYRRKGVSSLNAIINACSERLRPILLTAGTTVLGLLPMVLAFNINFISREVSIGAPSTQWWQQLSTSVAGGLTFATILTLFFTPVLIYLVDRNRVN